MNVPVKITVEINGLSCTVEEIWRQSETDKAMQFGKLLHEILKATEGRAVFCHGIALMYAMRDWIRDNRYTWKDPTAAAMLETCKRIDEFILKRKRGERQP